MKILLFLTLLGVTLLSNVFVFGQGRKPGFELGQTPPGYIKPPMVLKITGGRVQGVWTQSVNIDSIRIMSPDRMPCRVMDLSRMEPMPVQRYRNLDSMVIKIKRPLMVQVLPVPGRRKVSEKKGGVKTPPG